MPQLESQKKLIHETDWDALIILDACRYDYFEQVYENYLDGELIKAESKGSSTGPWLVKNFPKKYNVDYLSGNPHVNSIGIPLDREIWGSSWNPAKHFQKIVDIWDFGWNGDLGTVLPSTVNRVAKKYSKTSNSSLIIHYIQPHFPYISLGGDKFKFRLRDRLVDSKFLGFVRWKVLVKLFGEQKGNAISRQLGIPPLPSYPKKVANKIGLEGLKEAYEYNLRLVLSHVESLASYLKGEIIVTTDHGEAFGEEGIWGHSSMKHKHVPVLTEIPWLEIKK